MDYINLQNSPMPKDAENFCDCSDRECAKIGVQYANVSTPIDITPHVEVGEIETECIGEPDVCCIEKPCEKANKILISQKICIKIPIKYDIIACVGESSVDCDKPDCE